MSCTITYKGKKYSEEQFKEYFINNKQEFTTSIAKNKDVIDSFKRKMEGIDFIFSQSPELASIGSKAQYLQYLSTIFKTSKVKDIVYHGSNEKIEKFDKSKSEVSDVIYFSNDVREAIYYSKKQKDGKRQFIVDEFKYINFTGSDGNVFYIKKSIKETEEKFKNVDELKKYSISKKEFDNAKNKFGNLNPSVLNIKKLYNGVGEDLFFGVDEKLKKQGFDGFITNNDEGIDSILAVFEPEQIHILGSKQDIDSFKKFVEQPINKEIKPKIDSSKKIEVSKVNYTKNTPNDKSKGFFFTENLQAYLANRGRGAEERFDLASKDVKLDVTATNNQAGIRRNNGIRNLNAFAIISKKYQQNGSGSFVKEEGQFKDTDEDFELFKKYNIEAIDEAIAYNKPLVIAEAGIATGKSALPLRFAEWLNNELKTKLGIQGTIKENTSTGYKGYGIFNLTQEQPIVEETNQKITKEDTDKLPPCIG